MILGIDFEAKSIKPIAFDTQTSTVLLDMDDNGRMLIKESSLVKSPKISVLEGNEKTLVYQYPDIEEQMEFEQGTLKCSDASGESFAFHRLVSLRNLRNKILLIFYVINYNL